MLPKDLLLGNYAMILRSDSTTMNGVSSSWGIIFSVGLIVVSVVSGLIYFKNYNILSRE